MRFGTTSYFLGLVQLTGDFKFYKTKKKSRVIFCEARLAPARPKSRKRKPLTRVIIYFFGNITNQVETYYKKGDYVLVQGRLKIFKKKQNLNQFNMTLYPTKEYHLNVIKMSLVRRL